MALGALFYAVSSPLVGVVFNGIERRYVTQLAFIIATVALLYFGPSKLLGYPDGIYMVIIGVILLGISVALIFVPLLSEIISAV
jgi:MFS family permease